MRVKSRRVCAPSSGRRSRPPTVSASALAPPAARHSVSIWLLAAIGRPSSWGWAMRSKAIVGALVASLWLIADLRGAAPRFYPDDPLAVDNDRVVDVTASKKIDLDDYYDFLENSFGKPGDRSNVRAANVNTLDEVPDSSWFTNRIGAGGMSTTDLI